MKTSRLLLTTSALFLALASCDKSRPGADGAGGGGSADALAAERAQIEEERMALERQRLEEERAALEEEKDALRAEREARLAMREQELEDDGMSLEERQRQLADRELELSGREDDLASREASLSEQELEIAGRDALDGWVPEPLPEMQEPVADYDTFYEDLQPYGSWYETPDYGYVYQPTVVVQDSSWRPYTRGRWACTNLGWNWVSDEPFGWACFHYGRWALLDGRGWVWVPGDEWAPSWVCWREGSEHVGWAPLPPETLCYRGRGWDSSVEAEFGIGSLCFSFVPRRHMADPLWRHCLPVTRNPDCIRQTNNITNIRFHHDRIIAGGPAYDRLRREVGKPWPVYQIQSDRYQAIRDLNRRNASVSGSRLEVFAPNLNTPWNGQLKPSRVAGRWDEVKVVRAESGIKPLWSERFRESRVKQKEDAAKTAGPTDKVKQFEENRLRVGEAQRKLQEKQQEMTEARREKQLVRREVARATERPAAVEGRVPSTGKPAVADKAEPKSLEPAPSLAERQRQAADRLRETRAKRAGDPATGSLPAGEKESTAERLARLREDLRQREAERVARQTGTQREPAVKGRETPQVAREGTEGDGRAVEPPAGRRAEPAARQPRGTADDGTAVAENERRTAMEEARRQQQEAIQKGEQARNDSEQTTRRQQMEENRRQQVEANRQQQEQARQESEDGSRRGRMEEARQQQQEAARAKAEQARQEQSDRQRETEAARARQMEVARERQELARREAEENNRRQQQEEMRRQQQEQAREQQEEARRQQQDQARQQQEEMRRQQQQEQARQQQEERARQQEQMREQQEEARRQGEERARQQQEERARQLEQARQQQEERARQQQEEQQRRQEERAREQQERQEEQRQRGR
jgi:hypothetical protein